MKSYTEDSKSKTTVNDETEALFAQNNTHTS